VLGVASPILLAALAVLALIALGFFDEPETTVEIQASGASVEEVDPGGITEEPLPEVVTEEPLPEIATEESPVGIEEPPPFVYRSFDPEGDGALPVQSQIAVYLDNVVDGIFQSEVRMDSSQALVLDFFYCGKTPELLEEIEEAIEVSFELDELLIPEGDLYFELMSIGTRTCNYYRGVVSDMVPGEHRLLQTMNVRQQIYDGWETWGPEELTSGTLIQVESGE
jgi:hypothetical protein